MPLPSTKKINEIFRDLLYSFIIVYLDDILIFSKDLESHCSHAQTVLQQLRDHHLYAKLEKCLFEQSSLPFLGCIISSQGFTMEQDKLQGIHDWPQPVGLRALQRFLGFTNYYHHFITDYSTLAAPLTAMTKKGCDLREWSPKAQSAFQALKEAFCTSPCLHHPDLNRPVIVEVDTSAIGARVVLSHC
ncbi:uncharacterized protein LOC115096942 [Rhinatrema bivittatum]|uniref:uncharacterized protein LOC115096942 n=1 Tax=Rhinatrema bivittatum TaxID=194408 RepID=UPI00112C2AE1|nr:uncharacterized protein LOC115096942 [Rhinatrema bivittatum]